MTADLQSAVIFISAVKCGGRIYLGWYSGGTCEPHIENFNLLVYSDDDGESWSKPLLVIPSDRENFVHALDIQLWTAPDGRLYVFWVQNNVKPADLLNLDGDFYNGKIYLTYDRERSGAGSAREILFTVFSEDDIINEEKPINISIVSKP